MQFGGPNKLEALGLILGTAPLPQIKTLLLKILKRMEIKAVDLSDISSASFLATQEFPDTGCGDRG